MKAAIVIIMLLGFAWAWPPTRERMNRVVLPVIERVAPQAERLLNPLRKSGAKRQITYILREISGHRVQGRPLPDPRAFKFWVRQYVESIEGGVDPWGSPFYLKRSRATITVGSPGPDRTATTADDITVTVPYEE